MSADKKSHDNGCPESDHLESQPSREGTRRNSCTGRPRHPRECACGRRRTLTRHGRRWRRLETCSRCTRVGHQRIAPVSNPIGKGDDHE
jgi:hypothetical protein